jgi:hypothetical protein
MDQSRPRRIALGTRRHAQSSALSPQPFSRKKKGADSFPSLAVEGIRVRMDAALQRRDKGEAGVSHSMLCRGQGGRHRRTGQARSALAYLHSGMECRPKCFVIAQAQAKGSIAVHDRIHFAFFTRSKTGPHCGCPFSPGARSKAGSSLRAFSNCCLHSAALEVTQ